MSTRVPLLIDCDTGIDDALALLYAAASDDAEIVGVGCVAGNVELPHIVRNTLGVLELAGRTEVEVAVHATGVPCDDGLSMAMDIYHPAQPAGPVSPTGNQGN